MRFILIATVASVAVGCAGSAPPAAPSPQTSQQASSLDPTVQAIAREELDRAVGKWKASSGVAIVIEPATGAVLASEGRIGDRSEPTVATARTYITGSTLKTFTYAAALEEKTIAPDAKLDCATRAYGAEQVEDVSPHGMLSMADALAVSSNVGASRVYDTLGLPKLYTYFRKFHFDDAPSHLPTVNDPRGIQAAILANGELAETTPMQMAAAYGAVFNGGNYVAPAFTRGTAAPERVIGPEATKTLVAMLENVVAGDMGTGAPARIEGHRVAGKTGTGDHHGGYWASFAGTVLDAKRPLVIFVGLEVSKGSGATGGSAAAPAFKAIAARLL